MVAIGSENRLEIVRFRVHGQLQLSPTVGGNMRNAEL
jgi:hypothetical protein